jgi:hypothetical protein
MDDTGFLKVAWSTPMTTPHRVKKRGVSLIKERFPDMSGTASQALPIWISICTVVECEIEDRMVDYWIQTC